MKTEFAAATTSTPDSQPLPSWRIADDKIFVNDKLVGQPPPVTIYFYEQHQKPDKPARELPEGVQIRRVHFADQEDKAQGSTAISEDQFAALYNAVAKASAWWPITKDKGWDWRELFDKTDMYVMYQKDMPVGFFSLDHQLEDPDAVKLLYIGVVPSRHGKGLGGYLLDQAIAKAWSREDIQDGRTTQNVVLDTAPGYDRMLAYDKPVSSLYENRGYALNHNQVSRPGDPGTTLNQFNFPKYWQDIDAARLETDLARKFNVAVPEVKLAVALPAPARVPA